MAKPLPRRVRLAGVSRRRCSNGEMPWPRSDPSVAISWSDDGGVKWSVPLIRKLGRHANARQRVTVLNTGLSGPQGRRWRIDVSDPVYVSLMGGEQSADIRAV